MRTRNRARQTRCPAVNAAKRRYARNVRSRAAQENPASRRRTTVVVAQGRRAAPETSVGPVQAALHGLFGYSASRPIYDHLDLAGRPPTALHCFRR